MPVGVRRRRPRWSSRKGKMAMQSQPVAGEAAVLEGGKRSGRPDRAVLRQAWANELERARAARAGGAPDEEWRLLERAHILSQPLAGPHLRTHLAMLAAALRRRDRGEVLGQLVRLVLAGPGSLTGRYPAGNTGGADVSAFVPMPIPDDLRPLLEGRPQAAS